MTATLIVQTIVATVALYMTWDAQDRAQSVVQARGFVLIALTILLAANGLAVQLR